MKTYIILLLSTSLLLTTSDPLFSQSNYSDYQKAEIIMNDNFDSVINKWELDGFQILSGWLTKTKGSGLALVPVDVDQKRDFELEISIQFNSPVNMFQEVIFGDYLVMFSPWAEKVGLKHLKPGFSIWYDPRPGFKRNPDPKYIVFSGKHYPYESSNFNLVTLRKIGSNLFLFFNKEMVAQTPFKPFVDSKVGVYATLHNPSIDFVNMNYIDKAVPIQRITVSEPNSQSSSPPSNSGPLSIKSGGKYFGLIIGVSDYEDTRLNLDKPVKDAVKLKEILVKSYSFNDSTTFLLLNPTRQKLIAELFRLRKVVGPNDNLLIFYAGHGYWDEDAKQGYWWASDAHADDPSFWLSNSDVREQIRSIKSGHTLLISDACFSGGIFKTRSGASIKNASLDLQVLYKMPSRRAITSGTMTTVPDQSVFFEFLSKRLLENQSTYLSSQQLFDSFRLAVINNSLVVPQDGVIAEAGDEGGDFIFIRKN